MEKITLTEDILIGNQIFEAGRELETTQETVAVGIAAFKKSRLRMQIAQVAGDTESQLGTTADVAMAALLGVAHLVVLLSKKGSVDIKSGIAESPVPVALAETFLANVASGAIKVPLLVKGLESVFAEMAGRATATAEVLSVSKA
jgi:hypothetical protein